MTHSCSHHIDLHIPEHPLLLQLFSHALANVSSQNQATATPVSPTASRVSDQTPSNPFKAEAASRPSTPTLLLCDLCCSTGCSRAWQRNSRHPFSIWKRVPVQTSTTASAPGQETAREQGNGCHITEGRISWDYQQPPGTGQRAQSRMPGQLPPKVSRAATPGQLPVPGQPSHPAPSQENGDCLTTEPWDPCDIQLPAAGPNHNVPKPPW